MTDGARIAVGNRIKQRREELGLSQAELASRLGRTQTSISYWEGARRVPDLDDLLQLSTALELDPGELLASAARVESPKVLFRAQAAWLQLEDFAEEIDGFIETADAIPIPKGTFVPTVRDPIRTAQELIAVADVARPPVIVDDLARACGVRVVEYPFGADAAVSGFLLELEAGPVIGVNSDQWSVGRRRFTVGHELGHYLLRHHDSFHIDLNSAVAHGETADYDWRIERAANDFSAELLMPAQLVVAAWHETHNVAQLAERFIVSREAMGFRLINLGLRNS